MKSDTLERMVRKQKGDKTPTTGTIRLPVEMVRKLAIIASVNNLAVQDIAAPILHAEVERLYAEAAKKIAQDVARGKRG